MQSRLSLVSLRIAAGKIVIMMLGLLCGASIGREGRTVQVGAALMFAAGRRTLHYQRGLLLAGAAAGIAAAFNTPLAGIVFGIEELSRSFESRTSGLVIGAVIAAGLTSLGFAGDYTYFGSTPAVLPFGGGWLVVPVCAVVGGFAGGLFSRILILFARGLCPDGRAKLSLAIPSSSPCCVALPSLSVGLPPETRSMGQAIFKPRRSCTALRPAARSSAR